MFFYEYCYARVTAVNASYLNWEWVLASTGKVLDHMVVVAVIVVVFVYFVVVVVVVVYFVFSLLLLYCCFFVNILFIYVIIGDYSDRCYPAMGLIN